MQHKPCSFCSCCCCSDQSMASKSLANANSAESGLLSLKINRPSVQSKISTSVGQVVGSSGPRHGSGSPHSRSNVDKVQKPEADAVGNEAGKIGAAEFAGELLSRNAEFSLSEKPKFEVDFAQSLSLQKRIPIASPVQATSGLTTTGETANSQPIVTAQDTTSSEFTMKLGEAQSRKSAETQSVSSGASADTTEAPQQAKPAEMQDAVSGSTTEQLGAQQTAKTAETKAASTGSTMESVELELHLSTKPAGTLIPLRSNASGSQGTSSGSTMEAMELEVTHIGTPGGKQGTSPESSIEVEVPPSASQGSTLESPDLKSTKKLKVTQETKKPDWRPESNAEFTKELEVPFGEPKTVGSGSSQEMAASANPDDKTTREGQESETKEEASMDTHGEEKDEREMPIQEEESSPLSSGQEQTNKQVQKVPVSSHNVKKPRENLVIGELSMMVVEVIECGIAVPLNLPLLGDILENQHRYRSIAVRCGCQLVFSRRVIVKRIVKWSRFVILILRAPTDVALKRFRGLLDAANPQFKKAVPYDTEKPRERLLTSEHLPDNLEVAVCSERIGRSVVAWERMPLEMPRRGMLVVKEQNLILPNNEVNRRVLAYLYPDWGFQESKPVPNNRLFDTAVDAAEMLEKQQNMKLKQGGGPSWV